MYDSGATGKTQRPKAKRAAGCVAGDSAKEAGRETEESLGVLEVSTEIRVKHEVAYITGNRMEAKVEDDDLGVYLWVYGKSGDARYVKFISREDAVEFFSKCLEAVE